MNPGPTRRNRKRQAPERDELSALADDDSTMDGDRHYLHDPDGLLEHARDEDEIHQDEILELDQTELSELGLTLDDPHQPEPE